MNAFLLAAGEGRRLRPLTDALPKCLVPIRGTPLLALWLQLLERHAVTKVLVNLHAGHERVSAFLDAHPTSLAIDRVYEPRLLGSAGTVLANRAFVAGERHFFIAYADVLTNIGLGKMLRFHVSRGAALTLGVTPTDRPTEKGTVVVDSDDNVVAFEEKSQHPRSHLANAGIYVASQELFNHFPAAVSPGETLDFGYHILPRMTSSMGAYPIHEFLMDIGTPDAYQMAQAQWPGFVDDAGLQEPESTDKPLKQDF